MGRQPLPAAHDMKRLSLILLFALASPAWAGPLEDVMAANSKGDYTTELRIVRPLAESGTAWAQFFLGMMYQHGQGVIEDYAEAGKWYRLAATQGEALAQYNLAVMYGKGQGVVHDEKEAAKWHRQAAEQGYPASQYALGLHYFLGLGVLEDAVRAHMWFNLAAVSGNESAQKNRDLAASTMTPQQIGEAQKLARECQARQFKGCD